MKFKKKSASDTSGGPAKYVKLKKMPDKEDKKLSEGEEAADSGDVRFSNHPVGKTFAVRGGG